MPAEALAGFNECIHRPIEVVAAYFGEGFRGHVPAAFGLKGKDAKEQFVALARTLLHGSSDLSREVAANHLAVFLGFFFWEQSDFTTDGFDTAARDEVLEAVRKRWATGEHASIRLGVPSP